MERAPVKRRTTSKYTITLLFRTVNKTLFFVTSGFRREVAKNCVLLGY
jgi:hypothetical protein